MLFNVVNNVCFVNICIKIEIEWYLHATSTVRAHVFILLCYLYNSWAAIKPLNKYYHSLSIYSVFKKEKNMALKTTPKLKKGDIDIETLVLENCFNN